MSVSENKNDSIVARVKENPGPAARWGAVMAFLVLLEFGAIWSAIMSIPWGVPVNGVADILPAAIGGVITGVAGVFADIGNALASVPTLLERGLVPNQGYHVPGEGWQGTFLGLEPAYAWLVRLTLVYAYAAVTLYWAWRGYMTFRRHYRYADWTPGDDMVDRFRSHNWGRFGLVLVAAFLVMALFAPVVSPTTESQNLTNPYGNQIEYYNDDAGEVQTTTVGTANVAAKSKGDRQNFGVWSYDKFDRFHPVGTLTTGKDLFTFMAFGARISLFIGIFASALAGGIALSLALLTSYYKGLVDLAAVLTSDAFSAMPRLLVLIMLVTVLQDHWISDIYSGAFILAFLFGIWGWMGLWRAIRGPSFQIVENEWVTAAKGFGDRPWSIVKKHVAPYVIGYLLIYLSMSLGGYIIGSAGLAYLGLGVTAPTPELGRAIAGGQSFITTDSWHISVFPGVMITLIVLGFNALGDGIRDAIDPQSSSDDSAGEAAAAGGGA
ncbi:ABC transporter permease [Halobacterium jilantaiense]|uniref:Peptide/nickel transport system permease protein n=1 Tax=Halobacterium jilantaiense TaxID=355548 RepID=A0A1I0PRH8_9EURY|nr:ABC transporter permease [Halobacterium jilantaiense]SEW16988.1 peptide/nickel transport system permease protein [Halobacterium jilantaiense]